MARTIVNAEYQLEKIMPIAQAEGCQCEFSREDFDDFINYKWSHKQGCPAPKEECLPNAAVLMEAMRHVY